MGKWEAVPVTKSESYVVHRNPDMLITVMERGNVNAIDHEKATRYALALNIVDAGVDFGEFKELLGEWGALETWFNNEDEVSRLVIPHDLYHNIKVLFTSIANAVEGERKVDT